MNLNLTARYRHIFYAGNILLLFILTGYTSSGQNYALNFNGTNGYISLGDNANLHLEKFTVECWFKRTGAGVATSTGTAAATAVPLISKGRAESDGNNRDLNFFLGIDSASHVLTTDIEEGPLQYNPGLNHPLYGSTLILTNVWYHAAMTFDGNQVSIYLNGRLEISLGLGVKTQSQSIQYAGIASALNSAGIAKGFFKGVMDEVRIWNYARDIREIQNGINTSILSPEPGLMGSWSFNEGSGTHVYDASVNNITGTLYGTGYNWVAGAPMNMNVDYMPDNPVEINPLNNDTCVAVNNAVLKIHAYDKGGDTLTVKFFGRPAYNSPPPFTIVPMPDTQHYVGEISNGTNDVLKSQTNWIVANRASRNIQYVTQLGDCVENGDNGGDDTEWRRADTSFAILENPVTTGLPQGIPYSISVGNHDQSPNGHAYGTTTFYNQFFGVSRFGTRNYYGGHYGLNNDNHFSLFTASGMDFIEVSLEFDPNIIQAVINWADSIVQAYPNRRAIVTTHYFLNIDGTFGPQGQAIYDQLKHNSNLFLLLCGHKHDENMRSDVFNGNTVHTILSDYQERSFGGYGWLKLLEFKPDINKISVKTYSPFLDQYETDWNSEYTLDYNMTPAYQLLGSVSVTAGSEAAFLWSGLQMDSSYEWYAEISDGKYQQVTELNKFRTNNNEQIYAGSDVTQCGGQVSFGVTDTSYTYLWSTGSTNPVITVNQTGNYILTATSIFGNCPVKDTVTVTINPIPQSYLGPDTSACGQFILGATTDNAFVYTWQDGSNDSVFTALNTGVYSLYIQNSITGCYSSDTASVVIYPFPVVNLGSDITQCGGQVSIGIADTNYAYLWSTGSANPVVTVDQTGYYTVTATSIIGNCSMDDTIAVTINSIPQSWLGPDTSACGQFILGATTDNAFVYTWQDGSSDSVYTALNSGIYSLYIQNSITGCNSSDTISVVIYPLPVVNLGNDITQCGGSVDIGTAAMGNTYLWSTGSTDPFISVNQTGIYILNATSNNGNCKNSDSIFVTINAIPEMSLGNDTAGCDKVMLNAYIGTGYSYLWQDGTNSPFREISNTGQYSITVANIVTGCYNTDTINVEIYPLPDIDLGSDTTCASCDFDIHLHEGFQSYLWNTGSTGSSIHVSSPGSYSVIVISDKGCISGDSIRVRTGTAIYPNPFSDFLIVNLQDYSATPEFKLFDQLGHLVQLSYKRSKNNFIINTRELSKGIYFLRMKNGDEVQKFTVMKL